MTPAINSNIYAFPYAVRTPQVMVFPSGIQIITRNSEGEVSRIYYFRKADEDVSKKIVYFYDHSPCTPYEFETCWDIRSSIHLSAGFIFSEYKSDGLDRVLYQYFAFDVETRSPEQEEPILTQCLLKSSNFSRTVDEAILSELVLQGLPLPRAEATSKVLKTSITSRRRISHHDWLHWKSSDIYSIPLNRNGQEIGRMRMRKLPELLQRMPTEDNQVLVRMQPPQQNRQALFAN